MANKLSRTVLKGIVKECLVEIMEEAFFPQPNSQMQERLRESRNAPQQKVSNFRDVSNQNFNATKVSSSPAANSRNSYLDTISFGKKEEQPRVENKNFETRISQVTESMTSDPILANILRDTARTTLQEQSSAESARGHMSTAAQGDQAARAVSAHDPSSIFGAEAAGKWAQLAFSDNISK